MSEKVHTKCCTYCGRVFSKPQQYKWVWLYHWGSIGGYDAGRYYPACRRDCVQRQQRRQM